MLNPVTYKVTRQKPVFFGLIGTTGYRFHLGGDKRGYYFTDDGFADLNELQKTIPAVVFKEGARTFWMYQGEVFWENDAYSEQTVLALLMARRAKTKKKSRK